VLSGLTIRVFPPLIEILLGLVGGIIILLAFPVTILFGIDASRVNKTRNARQNNPSESWALFSEFRRRCLARSLVAFGAVYPFFGLREDGPAIWPKVYPPWFRSLGS